MLGANSRCTNSAKFSTGRKSHNKTTLKYLVHFQNKTLGVDTAEHSCRQMIGNLDTVVIMYRDVNYQVCHSPCEHGIPKTDKTQKQDSGVHITPPIN